MDITDFAGKSPELLPEKFLVGDLNGWGVVESGLGSFQSRFTVEANGVAVNRRRRFYRDLDF